MADYNPSQYINLLSVSFSLEDLYDSPAVNIDEKLVTDFLAGLIKEEDNKELIAELEKLTQESSTALGANVLSEGGSEFTEIKTGQTGIDTDKARAWANTVVEKNLAASQFLPLRYSTAINDFSNPVHESAVENGSGGGISYTYGNLLANDLLEPGAKITRIDLVLPDGQEPIYATQDAYGFIYLKSLYGKLIVATNDYHYIKAGDYIYILLSPSFDYPMRDELEVFRYTITDVHGGQSSANLSIEIIDDVPTARDDINDFSEKDVFTDNKSELYSQNQSVTLTGNLLDNDTKGLDGAAIIDVNGEIPIDGIITINNKFYQLLVYTTEMAAINAGKDGAGYYQIEFFNSNIAHETKPLEDLEFTYTLQDGDNDISIAKLIITVEDESPKAYDDFNEINENDYGVAEIPSVTGNIYNNDYLGPDGGKIIKINNVIEGLDDENNPQGFIELFTAFGHFKIFTTDAQAMLAGFNYAGDYIYTYNNNTVTSDDIIETFQYTLQDIDNDQTTAHLKISIIDSTPTLSSFATTIDEQEFTQDLNTTINASLNFGIKLDGLSSVTINNVNIMEGVPYSLDSDLYELTINDFVTGDFTFTVKQPTTESQNDEFQFEISLTDNDGDVATGFITINVLDATPTIAPVHAIINESDLKLQSEIVVNGFLDYKTFGDGFGSLEITGMENDNWQITLLDAATGEFEFKLLGPLEIAGPITTIQFQANIFDSDGDVASAPVTFDVINDVPIAKNDDIPFTQTTEPTILSGNLLTNDQFSVDVPNFITEFRVDFGTPEAALEYATLQGTPVISNVDNYVVFVFTFSGNSFNVLMPNGAELYLQSDGEYNYTLPQGLESDFEELIEYTLRDVDNDIDSAVARFFLVGNLAFDNLNFISDQSPIISTAIGNVLLDSNFVGYSLDPIGGQDLLGVDSKVIKIKSLESGEELLVPDSGSIIITNSFGDSLEISSDGSYTFSPNPDLSPYNSTPIYDAFEYTIANIDGVESSALLIIDSFGANFNLPDFYFYGDAGNNILNTTDVDPIASAFIFGGPGNDQIVGSIGKDIIFGNEDNDNISGQGDSDLIQGNAGDDIINGNDGNDRLIGNNGNDTLIGGIGDDFLYPDNEFINDNALLFLDPSVIDDPTLILQPTIGDNNILTGGEGEDTFVFNLDLNSNNTYTITDLSIFEQQDTIRFDDALGPNFTDVVLSFEQTDGDLELNLSNLSTIILKDVNTNFVPETTIQEVGDYLSTIANIEINTIA